MSQNDWLVRLPAFQGPLDLLLFLVRRAEVDIHEVEIHALTERYLACVRHLSRIDVDLAGEFLVMAATLIEIKSRSLAPVPVADGAEPSLPSGSPAEDPRSELIRQLLAYQRYRSAAECLESRRRAFAERTPARIRPGSDVDAATADAPVEEWELEDLHVGDLQAAFERIAAAIDLTRVGDHTVEYDDTPISLHQEDVIDRLERASTRTLALARIFEGRSHGERIGIFLAILELVRQGRVRVAQDDLDGDIEVALSGDVSPTD